MGRLDTYLDIAATVLRAARRPLSPRAILAAAYRSGIVPQHLYGKTQHKTLQARVSEDIIAKRENSAFFRTAPGRFFLREFLTDTTIPEEHRRPFPARRRFRDLMQGPALAISRDVLRGIAEENTIIDPRRVFAVLADDHCQYEDPKAKASTNVFVRSFVCVRRNREVLTYRLGRYRENRDAFMARRSIGFSALVHIDEHTLFNCGDFGIVDAGVRATKIDLDIPEVPDVSASGRAEASLCCFVWACQGTHTNDLLAVVGFQCPDWFEPVKRRLALNDLAWMNVDAPVNNIEDFDPWSRLILLAHYRENTEICGSLET